jgi:ParB family chromosome partitioning protein
MEKAKRLRDLKVSARDQLMIDPRIIEIEKGHNPRNYSLPENRQHLDELKGSIRESGILQPLLVRFEASSGSAILVDGECRLRAAMELIAEGVPIEAVPTVQVAGKNEAERLIIALTANTGKPLSQWESGHAFVRLKGYGWSEDQISTRLGFSIRFVNRAIELADAPDEVKHLLSEQAVTPSLAIAELRAKAAPEAIETLKARAVANRQNGNSGPARKTQENPVPNVRQLLKAVSAVVASVQDDIFDNEHKYVEVSKAEMRKLAAFVGIKKEGE